MIHASVKRKHQEAGMSKLVMSISEGRDGVELRFSKEERQHGSEKLEKENARWESGRTSFGALRLGNKMSGTDDEIMRRLLDESLFEWRFLDCLDGMGAQCKVLIIKARAGDQDKLKNYLRQMIWIFQIEEAAFMDGGKAVKLSSDGTELFDLGSIDPSDFTALAQRLLGEGSEVVEAGVRKYPHFGSFMNALCVHTAYATLDNPKAEHYTQWAERLRALPPEELMAAK